MKDYPVIKFTIIFVIGIILRSVFTIDFVWLIVVAAACLAVIFMMRKVSESYSLSLISNVLFFILILLTGNKIADLNTITSNKFFDEIRFEKDVYVYGTVTKIDLIKTSQLNFYLTADSISSETFFVKDKINLLCKIQDTDSALADIYKTLLPGNRIELNGYYHKGNQRRNPGEFDYDKYLSSIGIVGILSSKSVDDVKIMSNKFNFFRNVIHQSRKNIDEKIRSLHNQSTANLLRGLLLADRREIDYDTRTQFINAGVIHVLAVSGLHVGFIALIFLFLFGRFNMHLKAFLTIAGLLCFMFLTGIPPSVFRATVMAIVIIIGFISNRSTNIFNSIAIAALIILLIDPNEIYSAGFQLSFSAVIAIGVVYPIIESWVNKLQIQNKFLKYVLLFMAVSLSAQIGTLPLTLIYFGKFSVIALFTNLIVIPAIGVIIGLAFFTLLISTVSNYVALIYAAANDLITDWLFKFINYFGALDFSHLVVNDYSLIDALIFLVFASILIFVLTRFQYPLIKIAAAFLVFANIYLFSGFDNKTILPEGYFSVMMIDVGQGDSFLFKFPNGETALIDAGNVSHNFDYGERVIIPLLQKLDINKIDYAFISHIDSDHYGGFVSLIYYDKIRILFKPETDTTSEKEFRFDNFIKRKDLTIETYTSRALNIGGVRIYILTDDDFGIDEKLTGNNKSAVLKFVYGKTSFLFTGDIEKKAEEIYSNYFKNFLNVDVLKVGHHGSKTSSSNIFLNYTTPEISLISAGYKNKFKHPAPEIVNRLEDYSPIIYRTDLDKSVILTTDGNTIRKINWEN